MKKKLTISAICWLIFSASAFSQHDGYFMPSFTDSLTYLPSFNYPDSLKERQDLLDVRWALSLGIEQLNLINGGIRSTAFLNLDFNLQVVDEYGKISFRDPTDWRLSLDLAAEAPSYEDGSTNHRGDGLLDKSFYAFQYRDEVWILHKGYKMRCDCPSKVVGYVLTDDGKRTRMLNREELTRAIAAAHQADKEK